VLAILVLALVCLLVAELSASPAQLEVIQPVVVITTICALVTWILAWRRDVDLFSEIGFVYLAMAFAYAVVPAVKFVVMNVRIPVDYDNLSFAALSPSPHQIGAHYWRHVLFFSGFAIGFLAVRLQPIRSPASVRARRYRSGRTIAILAATIVGCAALEALLSAPVSTYIEHYTRFDHLPPSLRRLVNLAFIVKSGGYFVLLALMFSDYPRHRWFIFIVAPVLCAYEIWSSLGSRIVGATIVLAVFAFYNLRVKPVRLRQGVAVMGFLALAFTAVGFVRSFGGDVGAALQSVSERGDPRADEFDAVFATSFHIYSERDRGTLPDRNWWMFVHEFIAVVPFVDHTTDNPQFWYARHYFPDAPVPPTTMGVIAESGLWGGELDLLVRSLINGALFAGLTRWYFRRRQAWWAITVYVYCYANCILTLKYSVLYLAPPLLRVVLPTVLFTALLLWWENGHPRIRLVGRGPRLERRVSLEPSNGR
jgi:hypothetical protein